MKKFYFCSFLFSILPFFFSPLTASAGLQFGQGVYQGYIQTEENLGNHKIPFDVSLVLGDDLRGGNSPGEIWDDIVPFNGSFVVDHEGGVFYFSRVYYNPITGYFEMEYSRPFRETTNSQWSLRFSAYIRANSQNIEGVVTSNNRGRIGTFSIGRITDKPIILKTTPILDGIYKGTWTDVSDGKTFPITIKVQSSAGQFVNPSSWELDFSPGRLGSAQFSFSEIPFDTLVVDYFSQTFSFTHSNIDTYNVGIKGKILPNGVLEGDIVSSLRGKSGSFKVKRVQ